MAGGVSAGSIDADDPPHLGAVRRFTVLYIEDNRLNAALMRHAMAQRQGVTLELAVDGQAGLEAARRLIPDLLLLDMGLPLISGPLVLEQLRADPVLAEIPCVAISANAMQADIQRALDAGCCDYITKPYSIDRVLDWVDRLRG
jgi:CheY-like chemotaxis protein